ncbi:MAG: hypothetical protein QOJ95_5839 [Mycobacterium sp.]|jgi:hypothetical protein|nr:hypothetical protein [Mycobacterium sp.]MDX6264332.1 hypothetical protein [Kribbellaceae bacterium]
MGRKSRARAARRAVQSTPRTPTASRDGLGALRQAVDRLLRSAVEAEVVRLIRSGRSWTDVAAGLGISRQGARQRYARVLD